MTTHHKLYKTHTERDSGMGETKFSIILCGHSHVPGVVEMSNHVLIVNPGSVGLQAYRDDFIEPHITETGSPHAKYSILAYQDNTCM